MAIRDAVDVVVGISRRSVRDVMDVDISAELWSMTLSMLIYTGALGPSVVLIRSDWGLRYASRAHSRSKIMLSDSIPFSMLSKNRSLSLEILKLQEVVHV